MKLIKGTLISNRYDVQNKIGSGGMAIVYKAIDRKLDRVVTLKIMREEHIEDEEFIRRFNIEARAAAKLNHPNIVKIFDVGRFKNIYYIVMEYIDGVTLKDLILSRGLFTDEEILGVTIQIASAISHAHEHDIVHRDVKPQNILVTMTGEVKVTDFGIATAINSQTEELNENTIGSVHYFSPEQARGSNVDEKSDIYSIGITMFEMACGKPPFDDDTVVAIAVKHINEPLPNVYDFNENISENVTTIINKATQKSKMNRYDSTEEMNNDLKRALTYETGEVYSNVKDFSKTNTLHLSEEDVKKIKEEAINAFYDDGDTIFEFAEDSLEEKKDKVFKLAILSVIVIMLIIFLLLFNNFRKDIKEVINVPNFNGMKVEEAMEKAYAMGFAMEEVKSEYSEEYEVGVVIQQDYEEGDTIYAGETVKVSVSLGSDKVEVPSVVGLTLKEAIEQFSNLPFKINETYVFDDESPINDIVEQTPASGEKIQVGTEVTLFISKGKQETTVIVPDVVGKTERTAKSSLTNNGLVVGNVMTSNSETVEEGKVISQTISAGSEVKLNTTVNIVVSLGKEIEEEDNEEEDNEEDVNTDIITETDETSESEEEDSVDENTNTNEEVMDILTINSLYLAEGEDSAFIKIMKNMQGDSKIIFENTVMQSDLPLEIPITGTGIVEYKMFVRNDDGGFTMIGTKSVDFGESE